MRFVASHTCEDDSSRFGLFLYRSDRFLSPVNIFSIGIGVSPYGYGVGWTEDDATLAVCAVFVSAEHNVSFFVVVMGSVCTLGNANLTANAAIIVSFHYVFWEKITLHYITPLR